MVGVEFQPLVRDLAKKLTAVTAELQGHSTVPIDFWEPNKVADEVADVHAYLAQAEDSSVDTIVSFLAILHIPDKDRLFQEMWRVLKPGGRIASKV